MKRLFIGFLFIMGQGERAFSSDLQELPRLAIDTAGVKPIEDHPKLFPLHKINMPGDYAEGYIYEDLVHSQNWPVWERKIKESIKYFNEIVFVQFEKKILGGSGQLGSLVSNPEKIAIVFDQQKGYSAYHHKKLSQSYHRNFIFINLDEINSNSLKYRFPHELQHIVRNYFNPDEEDWLNEGLSVFTEFFLNDEFPVEYLENYQKIGGLSLVSSFRGLDNSKNYFNNFLYIYYLYSHYGGRSLIKSLITSQDSGRDSIHKTLLNQLKGPKRKSSFWSFENSLINYQLALILNPFRNKIESDNFFSLKLEEAQVPSPYNDFSVATATAPWGRQVHLKPASAIYFEVDKKCLNLKKTSQSLALAVLIDMQTLIPERAVQMLEMNKVYCLESVQNYQQYLVLINPSNINTEVFWVD